MRSIPVEMLTADSQRLHLAKEHRKVFLDDPMGSLAERGFHVTFSRPNSFSAFRVYYKKLMVAEFNGTSYAPHLSVSDSVPETADTALRELLYRFRDTAKAVQRAIRNDKKEVDVFLTSLAAGGADMGITLTTEDAFRLVSFSEPRDASVVKFSIPRYDTNYLTMHIRAPLLRENDKTVATAFILNEETGLFEVGTAMISRDVFDELTENAKAAYEQATKDVPHAETSGISEEDLTTWRHAITVEASVNGVDFKGDSGFVTARIDGKKVADFHCSHQGEYTFMHGGLSEAQCHGLQRDFVEVIHDAPSNRPKSRAQKAPLSDDELGNEAANALMRFEF